MRKNFLLFILLFSFHLAFSASIIVQPGDTVDVFTELSSANLNDPLDSVFIDDGTGDIFFQAGPTDDGEYNWNLNGGLTSYIVSFSYNYAVVEISASSDGFLVKASRTNPAQERYFWVVYRNLPLKPLVPLGPTAVCAASSAEYKSFSQNAESYEWVIEPLNAGTIEPDTTAIITVNWSAAYTGTATLKVRGVKGEAVGEFSDSLEINVGTVPDKPNIEGYDFVEIGSTLTYKSDAALPVNWVLSQDDLATAVPNGNELTLTFTGAGTLIIKANVSNQCGESDFSNEIQIRIIDVQSYENEIDSLKAENEILNQKIEEIIADSTQAGINYRNIIEGLNEEKLALEEEINNLEGALSLANDSIQVLLGKIAVLEAQNLVLQEQINDLINQLNDATALNEQLSQINDELSGQLAELQGEFETLTGLLNEALGTIEELNTHVIELQDRISELETEKLALQNQISELVSENEELASQISDLEGQLEILSKVYILQWDVTEVVTKTFDTEIGNFSISLYPNPSPGQIFISCTEQMKNIKIFDTAGQLIKGFDVNGNEISFSVNRDEMSPGTYFIKIQTIKGSSTHQIIFQ